MERPDILLTEDLVKNEVTIRIRAEDKTVSILDFNECLRELQIQSMEMLHNRFAEICDWFIALEQYVKFEMIK